MLICRQEYEYFTDKFNKKLSTTHASILNNYYIEPRISPESRDEDPLGPALGEQEVTYNLVLIDWLQVLHPP